jgi:hypothetical protein
MSAAARPVPSPPALFQSSVHGACCCRQPLCSFFLSFSLVSWYERLVPDGHGQHERCPGTGMAVRWSVSFRSHRCRFCCTGMANLYLTRIELDLYLGFIFHSWIYLHLKSKNNLKKLKRNLKKIPIKIWKVQVQLVRCYLWIRIQIDYIFTQIKFSINSISLSQPEPLPFLYHVCLISDVETTMPVLPVSAWPRALLPSEVIGSVRASCTWTKL